MHPKKGIWWICEILHYLSIDLLFFELPINHNPPLYGCCRAATERTTVRNRRWKALKWVKLFPLIKSKTQECFLYISANYTENCFFVAQEKEMEKQRLIYQQARLHLRGASEMVLQSISASKGKESPPHKYQIIKYKCSALLMSSLSVVILS